jgi:hypothetical protein
MGKRFGLPPGSTAEQVQAAQQAHLDKNDPAAAAQYKQNMANIDAGNTAANTPVKLATPQAQQPAAAPGAAAPAAPAANPDDVGGQAAAKAGKSPIAIMLAQPTIGKNQAMLDVIAPTLGLPAGSSAEQILAADDARNKQAGNKYAAAPGAAQPVAEHYALDLLDYGKLVESQLDEVLGELYQTVGEDTLDEFAPASNPGGGNYLKALASAWYNGTFNTGDLHKGIKSQEDVEKILQRGIHCGDGKIRKYEIGYNSDFDGVLITSDDYYNYSDYDDAGNEVDERTGKPWGPYEYVEFHGNDLDESVEQGVAEGWKDVVAGGAMALGALGAGAQTMPNINAQQVELANKYYTALVQRAKEDGRELDTRTLNFLKAKAQDAAALKLQQASPQKQQGFPTQGSERRVAKDAGQFESQGMAEGKPKEKEADYGDDYQDMVARVKKLAGLGPLKTVYDPDKRVYKNVPTAVQPKK